MLLNEKLDAKTRQAWAKRFTDAVRTLSHVLNDRELGEIDKRLNQVLDYRKKLASQTEPQPSSAEPDKNPDGT